MRRRWSRNMKDIKKREREREREQLYQANRMKEIGRKMREREREREEIIIILKSYTHPKRRKMHND